ncbi:single-stranded DNA-binding protein [Weissella paramesenteroides]|uniref:Single-stranded DNA-binding protein n=1 Tax=Weissella paramesenteroides TaxID=1249 RepID=A0ABD4XJK7_WEIPA|nr:single-stranded DNA-binding protein [Weissella paramesenteroides]MDF8368716.1 single-stranded DNA-binding protein [Weissella paramesenteroides]MDF8370891.1 single-stranded DNA-binding protein [Weissella paramesenteroides]
MQTNIHVGRLLKEFELQTVGEYKDIKMVRLGLAVKRFLSQKSQTDFIYYVAFGKTAEMLSQYANKKGMPIELHFTIQSSHYQTTDGQSKYQTTNVITSFMPWATGNHDKSDANEDETVIANDESDEDVLQGLAGLVADDLEIR